MIRPISIAIVYGGERSALYAEAMKELILSKCSELPVIPLLVNSTTENGSVWDVIETTFRDSDYAFILLSEVYSAYKENDKIKEYYMSTPNLMLEYGYLIHKLGKNNIKVIMDFDYEKTKDTFVFPSDLAGDFRHSLTELRDAIDKEAMKNILLPVLSTDLNRLKNRHDLSNISNIEKQEIGMNAIFTQEPMADFSIDKQYIHIFNVWLQELNEFTQMQSIAPRIRNLYVISYLYSRILFFAALNEINLEGIDINKLKVSNQQFSDITNMPEAKSYNAIIDYITGSGNRNNTPKFFIDIANGLQTSTYGSLGLPDIIIKNYLGLCYWNASRRTDATKTSEKHQLCQQAYDQFDDVIFLAKKLFNGTLTEKIIKSYAHFNKARAAIVLGKDMDEWQNDYNLAEINRKQLSENEEFPIFLKNYFKSEHYHCINSRIDSTIEWYRTKGSKIPDEFVMGSRSQEDAILEELKKYEQTVVAGQSFFKVVKDNAKNNITKLSAT